MKFDHHQYHSMMLWLAVFPTDRVSSRPKSNNCAIEKQLLIQLFLKKKKIEKKRKEKRSQS